MTSHFSSPNISLKITITLGYERYIRVNELERAKKKEKILSYMAETLEKI